MIFVTTNESSIFLLVVYSKPKKYKWIITGLVICAGLLMAATGLLGMKGNIHLILFCNHISSNK